MSPSIKEKHDRLISETAESSSKAITAINAIIQLSQSKCDSHISKLNNTKATIVNDAKSKYDPMIQSLTDYCDGTIADFAAFQTNLQGKTKVTFTKLIADNTNQLRNDLDITIIDHNVRLKATVNDIKQEIKTALFLELQEEKLRIKTEISLELQEEKLRIKTEFTYELNQLKNEANINIKSNVNSHITALNELQYEIKADIQMATPQPTHCHTGVTTIDAQPSPNDSF